MKTIIEKLREAVYAAERLVSQYSDERQAELESAASATIRAAINRPSDLDGLERRKRILGKTEESDLRADPTDPKEEGG